ncbi:glycosyltransferase family 2 protein [Methanomethylovorans sp.]|uniref:glycosyltransferase family 2 protein n=1 Tax=Methanomethylovorans sp. TaxID=2758717 RepID=UPI00345EA8C4
MKLKSTSLFSVIIPTTGKRRILFERCLRSVGKQKKHVGEVLIVVDNDRSYFESVKKETESIAKAFPEWQFLVIHSGLNLSCGVSFARNFGASTAKGEYLCFLDDDDAWKPNYLERVFENLEFDVALSAFEKHTPDCILPEKTPPEVLEEKNFYVANPGLRGSNLVIRKEIYFKIGGFDEELPAFNDMDFGIRLCSLDGLRYKQIKDRLVEFHRHEGSRLSSPGCRENVEGMIFFLVKHSFRMGYLNEASFRERAIDLWGIDPWDIQNIRRRVQLVQEKNTLVRDFGNILHALETRLSQPTEAGIRDQDMFQMMIDKLCNLYEGSESRLPALRLLIATTITNSDTSLKNLVLSLKEELDASKWNLKYIEAEPINVLVVDNSNSSKVRERNRAFIENWSDTRIKIKQIEGPEKQQSIVGSRRYLCRMVKEHGWNASQISPVWLMDDDMQFTALVFGERCWTRKRHGSILHRLESILGRTDAKAIVCGNTYCPPVLPLVTIVRQINDIIAQFFNSDKGLPTWSQTMSFLASNPDSYYDLSREKIPEKVVPIESRWWNGGEPMDQINDILLYEILERIFSGLPVTRPLFVRNMYSPETAWWEGIDIIVSGGNTIILDEELLDEKLYWVIDYKGSLSRRGDTCWAINAIKKGWSVRGYNIPLYHQRESRCIQDTSLKEFFTHGIELDVLGVGLYESLLNGDSNPDGTPSQENLLQKIKNREELMNTHILLLKKTIGKLLSMLPEREYPRSIHTIKKSMADMPDIINLDLESISLSIPGENI